MSPKRFTGFRRCSGALKTVQVTISICGALFSALRCFHSDICFMRLTKGGIEILASTHSKKKQHTSGRNQMESSLSCRYIVVLGCLLLSSCVSMRESSRAKGPEPEKYGIDLLAAKKKLLFDPQCQLP